MLLPKKTKYRKVRKGKNEGVATRGNYIAFGDYALQSQSNNDITSRQIESARQAMTRHIKRGGKIWIRIFPHIPVTRKPLGLKMGGGKGNPEFFVAKVKAGTVLFEMKGVDEEVAREAMRLAAHKLPVKTKYRKVRKGKNDGNATRGNYIAFGDFALQSQANNDITSRQIESARQAMTRYIKRGGKIWIRIFPHIPVTRKPLGLKMGGGKGNPEFFVAKVKAGTVLFEMKGVSEEIAREAMRLASHKLPVKTRFIKKEEA